MANELERVMADERRLHDPSVRADAVELDRLLAPEFTEIGVSGRMWNRADLIASLVHSPRLDDMVVTEMSARFVTDDVIVVEYTTSRPALVARRTTFWKRSGDEWRCVHHQGTPVQGAGL